MRYFNKKMEEIPFEKVDLNKGFLIDVKVVKKEAIKPDFITKFAWDNEDYEIGKVFILKPLPEEPSQLDIIEAQVTYTAMVTDTLLGGIK